MNNRKYIVLQCYHVNVLTLSSLRQAKRYPANPLSCESRVCTTLDKNQMTSRFIKLIKDRLILFSSAKVLNSHEAYVRIIRCFQFLE